MVIEPLRNANAAASGASVLLRYDLSYYEIKDVFLAELVKVLDFSATRLARTPVQVIPTFRVL